MILQKLIKVLFKKLGLDVKRYSIAQNQTARLIKILADFDINLVFDVGANNGQFGAELREIGYTGGIVSFEPLYLPYQELQKAAHMDRLWEVAPRCAIGAFDGDIEINVSGQTGSSSILNMLDTHINAAPLTAKVGVENVEIKKMDTIAHTYLKDNSRILLKIDTQGYEDRVLDGAIQTLQSVSVLQLEVSLVELYAGQKLIWEMLDKIKTLGFELWGLDPAFVDSTTGRMLQVDAIFVKKK
jgi:FkbM family methyltransferase